MTESAYNRANQHMREGGAALAAGEYFAAIQSYDEAAQCFEEDQNPGMRRVAISKRATAERCFYGMKNAAPQYEAATHIPPREEG